MIAKLTRAFVLAGAVTSLVACTDDDDGTGMNDGTGETSSSTVNVDLTEYEVTLSPATVPAGDVTFMIYNGGSETHEFVVVETDLAAADLPTSADGSFDEEGEGVEVIDEIETIPAGSSDELSLSLGAANYQLLCNRVVAEGDELESHFHEGMVAPLEVEGLGVE
jgi:hypothetical protein